MVARSRAKSSKADRFVLDASVALAWFFADESDPYADTLANDLTSAQAIVPAIWPLEIANTLVIGERRKRNTAAQATAFLARLAVLPISIDSQTTSMAWGSIFNLARAEQLSAYDAAYLELAMRESIPLATIDDSLKAAAGRIGIILR